MKRVSVAVGAAVIAMALAGCGSSDEGDGGASAQAAQTTTTQPALETYAYAPTALALGEELQRRGFTCRELELETRAGSLGESSKATCEPGGVYISLSVYPSSSAMLSALKIKEMGQSFSTSGLARSSLAYAGNWIIECPDGGPGGQGSASCESARDYLGGTFDE